MTANTWVSRLVELGKNDREVIYEYLRGMSEAGPVPDVKWLKERVFERDRKRLKLPPPQDTDNLPNMGDED